MKNHKPKLKLRTDTLRNLTHGELDRVAGGIFTEATSCQPTLFNTCHPRTPNCPM